MRLIAIHPHMHVLGREMKVWAEVKDKSVMPNKPPRDVHWGERTVDEMGHAAILYTLDDEVLK
jgi:hypothetical protein